MTGTGDDGPGRYDHDHDYDYALGPRDRGGFSFSAAVHYSLSNKPATPRTNAVVINGRQSHRAGYSKEGGGASSYHAADDGAAASTSSSSRLAVRDERPDASPRRHRPPAPKPHAARYSAVANGVPERGSSGGVSRYESPSPPAAARPNGIVIGGSKYKHKAAGCGAAYNNYAGAGASSSSSRLNPEPAAPLRHHVPKPPRAHGAPSSSASASAAAQEEHDAAAAYEERCYRAGLELAGNMDKATLMSEVKRQQAAGVMGQGCHRQQQPEAEEEEKIFSFLLTDEEADADLMKVDEYYKLEPELEAERRKAAAGNGKRRRH
ncbi:unnamed protein product [Urochloa humidicola]